MGPELTENIKLMEYQSLSTIALFLELMQNIKPEDKPMLNRAEEFSNELLKVYRITDTNKIYIK